jgi:hypothetical protein
MSKLKIGVIGSGDVGKVLGAGFAKLGHQVKIGTRDANKLKEWQQSTGANASVGSFEETAKHGDVIILATLWNGTESALKMAGADNFAGKVVMDATNPLAFGPNGPSLAIGHTDSAGEQVQRWLPKARVVKAFNIVGNAHMVNPSFPEGTPDMFIAGNDADAKKTVAELSKSIGWPTIDLGGIEASRYLEPLAMVWITYFMQTKGWNHAIKLLRK